MNGNNMEVPFTVNKFGGFKSFLRSIQSKISCHPSSYLFYAFIIPVALTYLIYLSMGIHPFGNGSVLVLDLNGQYVYFFESLREAICGDRSFLYSFSRALGGEYLGMYAYYLASPLSYIVAIFPAHRILEALLTIILIKAGLCGFTFGFYLHKHSAHPNKIMVVVFSTMYALCSFAVVHQNNIMWTDALFWLPIVAYSIEQLITNRRYKLFVVSLAATLMSNYYIGYMVCIFCVVYFFYYFLANDAETTNPHQERIHGIKSFIRFGLFAVIAAMIAAIILFSAYYSLSFGKNEFSDPNWALKAKFDFLDFFTKFLPGTYDTVRPQGLPFVYCGLLVLITVPLYFLSNAIKSREKAASLALICFFVLCFVASPLDLIWHGFQNPNWLNYRYSFMLCFILLVIGYKGFGNLRKNNEKFILAISAFIILFVAVCQKQKFETYIESAEKLQTFHTVWLTIIVTVILFAVLCLLIRTRDFRKREGITAILASVICIEVFLNALGMVTQFDADVTYSGYSGYNNYVGDLRPIVEELEKYDTSFYRMEKLSHRKYNDNMALGIRGISNSTSTLNASAIEFLKNMGYTSRSHLSKYQGGTPVNDSLLGIKYLIDDTNSERLVHYFDKAIEGEKYDVYQNPYALSIAYGVSENVNEFDFSKYGTYFEKLNALVGALRGEEKAPQIFKPITTYEETLSGCTKDEKSSQTKYTAITDNSTACVSFTFTATESAEYYFYTPTNNPKECKIDVNGVGLGTYLGSDTRHIFSLGWYESGQTVNVRITLMEDPLTIINYYDYIWYLDKEVFEDCFADLADNPQLIIDEGYTADHLTGSIMTTEKNTKVMTTIPYDEGWKVFIDGEEIEIYKTLDALIAFDVEGEGEHSVELKYMPNIYVLGMTLTIFGIVLFIAICSADFVLKKTLLKNKTVPKVSTYWVLEDFDEDFSQFSEFEDEEVVPKKKMTDKVTEIFGRLKNKNNKKDNGDN